MTETVVVNIATLAVEVFGDGNQIANGGGRSNVWQELPTLVVQTHLPKSQPPFLHDIDLGVEVPDVGGVRETILDVDSGIDQRSIPKVVVLVERIEAIDQACAGPRSEQKGVQVMNKGNHPRCVSDSPGIPGDDVVISASQVTEGFAAVKDKVDTEFAGASCETGLVKTTV